MSRPLALPFSDQLHNNTDPIGYWTGGRQVDGSVEPNQGFIWDNSAMPISSSFWASDQPDNMHGNENHVNIWFHNIYVEPSLCLNDLPEGDLMPFICETDML